MVVDIGAHKGYYGAYALAHGARAVVSYEPETANFALLGARPTARRRGGEWQTRHCAVGAERGEAELHVMGASWGHALHPPRRSPGTRSESNRCGSRRSRTSSRMPSALAGGARVIVKVNIEGEECPTILGTPASAWAGVAELYVETHHGRPAVRDELARHLEAAGFTRRESAHPAVLRLTRR